MKSEAKYSDILVGIDISGDPRLSDLTDVLGKINHLRSEGIKFAIHLAEVPNHEETKAVLATKPDRIGLSPCDSYQAKLLFTEKVTGRVFTLHWGGLRTSGTS